MELSELQKYWDIYEKKVDENIHINKEILRRMLISKTEKRFNKIKIKAGINLIAPFILILFLVLPNTDFHNTYYFYSGLTVFLVLATIIYIWTIKYYIMIGKIDFSNPVLIIKKNIQELERYKIKTTKLGYIFTPFAMIGIFLVANIPLFSMDTVLFLLLVVIVMIFSMYYTFKYSIFERFKKLNIEIDEIEQLEK
jgi:hypothetical protein